MEGMIKKARKGDGEAFTRLMQAHMQDMYKTAWAILRNDEDAADAVSDTILACWEKLYQLKQDRYFKTWMIRILINNCNAILQKKRGIADPGTPEEKERFLEIPYVEKGYQEAEWREVLNGIEEKYRLVLLLYYMEGFSVKEIGRILEMPEATVRTRLARGRARLKEKYREPESRRVTG